MATTGQDGGGHNVQALRYVVVLVKFISDVVNVHLKLRPLNYSWHAHCELASLRIIKV